MGEPDVPAEKIRLEKNPQGSSISDGSADLEEEKNHQILRPGAGARGD